MATAALAFAPDPSPGNPVVLTPKDNKGIVHVEPGQLRLGTGSKQLDKVVWKNNTGDKVTFDFGDRVGDRAAEFFDPAPAAPIVVLAGDTLELNVAKSLTPGIHTYQVKCDVIGGGNAQGNSDPTVSCP